jgi:hypothetical protein
VRGCKNSSSQSRNAAVSGSASLMATLTVVSIDNVGKEPLSTFTCFTVLKFYVLFKIFKGFFSEFLTLQIDGKFHITLKTGNTHSEHSITVT